MKSFEIGKVDEAIRKISDVDTISGNIVPTPRKIYLNARQTLYRDHWYNSPNLYISLR